MAFLERISKEEKKIKDRIQKEMEEQVRRITGIEIEVPRRAVSQLLFASEPAVFKIEIFKVKRGRRNYIYLKKVKKFYEKF